MNTSLCCLGRNLRVTVCLVSEANHNAMDREPKVRDKGGDEHEVHYCSVTLAR